MAEDREGPRHRCHGCWAGPGGGARAQGKVGSEQRELPRAVLASGQHGHAPRATLGQGRGQALGGTGPESWFCPTNPRLGRFSQGLQPAPQFLIHTTRRVTQL